MSATDASFNLMDRGWIPVTMLADGSYRTMSITETLEHASEIRSIDGDIPLQRFALCRLLIAILYGAFGNAVEPEMWTAMLDAGSSHRLIAGKLREYCLRHHDRFDLFDAQAPFYQVAGLHTAKHEMSGLERLVLDVPSGAPFFTTRSREGLQRMSAAEAARWLVTVQAFDASGIKSGAVGDPRVKGGKGYPIGVAWSGHLGGYLIEAADLWRTLVLNFCSSRVFTIGDQGVDWSGDKPVWERPAMGVEAVPGLDQPMADTGDTRYFHGPATLMTHQSRRVLLEHEGETVTGVLICNGDRLKPQNAQSYETMNAWRRSDKQEKALKMPCVYMPRKHDPSQKLWRGLPLLTGGYDFAAQDKATNLRPLTLTWLQQRNLGSLPIRLHAFGVEYGNKESVIDSTVDDVLDLNLVVLTSHNPHMGEALQNAVNLTAQGVSELRNLASNIAKAGGMPPEPPRARIAETAFEAFDKEFRSWLRGIDSDEDPDAVYRQWCGRACWLLFHLGHQYALQASLQAIIGRHVVQREGGERQPKHYSVPRAEQRYQDEICTLIPLGRNELNMALSTAVPRSLHSGTALSPFGAWVAGKVRLLATGQRTPGDLRNDGYVQGGAAATAALAKLRHGACHEIGDDPSLLEWTMPDIDDPRICGRLTDDGTPTDRERAAYAAITLFAVHQQSNHERSVHTDENRSLGYAVGYMAHGNFNENGIRALFDRLQTANSWKQMIRYARSLIELLKREDATLNYGQLAQDLLALRSGRDTARKVCLRWGHDFLDGERDKNKTTRLWNQ